ncbi:MAG: hypothetical protein Q8R55_07655 [Candidatus Taylorbacteria bacterium]|nr:hypothetical protein [Candidatus Taylorbacteria bacterium]
MLPLCGVTHTGQEVEMEERKIQKIVAAVAKNYRVFGGGTGSEFNPITEALKNESPQFAAGVNVEAVVRFVVRNAEDQQRKRSKVRKR